MYASLLGNRDLDLVTDANLYTRYIFLDSAKFFMGTGIRGLKADLQLLFSEMDLAKSGLNGKVLIKERI